MEGLLLILGVGWLIWMLIRHPLKSIGWIFKLGVMLCLGLVAFGGLFYFMMTGDFNDD
jgi:hypothetical protein